MFSEQPAPGNLFSLLYIRVYFSLVVSSIVDIIASVTLLSMRNARITHDIVRIETLIVYVLVSSEVLRRLY